MPFTTHILHAICINLCRLPRYIILTSGKSFLISLGLITFELFIIPLAIFYDTWARLRFPKISHLIMVEDFISMRETPPFLPLTTDIPRREYFNWLSVKEWRYETQKLLKEGRWEDANKYIESIRINLCSKESGSYFLSLHFLESVQLAIINTIKWKELLPISSQEGFLAHRSLFVWWQAIGYEGAQILDWMAFSIHQKYRVPILLNDVPKIPV